MTTALDVDGPAAPPRSNGELVFAEPWESRAFGLAMTLADTGAFEWEDFRQALIARIAAWDGDGPYRYYRCWLEALERVLVTRGLVSDAALAERVAQLAARPAGHDHRH